MNVSSALCMDVLKGAEVLAGKSGLSRRILAAEVMEVPDISGWLTEGTLIISTFYSVKDSDNAQINMFREMIKSNCAGLMVKIGRFIQKLPKEIYDLANEHDMPIISLPSDMPFVKILSSLFEKIYSNREGKEGEYVNKFSALLNEEYTSLRKLLTGISSITGENVYYEDKNHRLIEFTNRKADWKRNSFQLLSLPKVIDTNQDVLEHYSVESDRIIIKVDEDGECLGYLHIRHNQPKRFFDDFQNFLIVIKEQAKLLLFKDRYKVQKRYYKEYYFLEQIILRKQLPQEESLIKRIRVQEERSMFGLFGFYIKSFSDVIAYSQGKDTIRTYTIYKKLYTLIDEKLSDAVLYNDNKYLYGLYVCTDKNSRHTVYDNLREIITELESEFQCEVICGISLPYDYLFKLNQTLDEVKLAIQTHIENDSKSQLISYEETGINRVLYKLKNDRDVLFFIDSMLNTLTVKDKNEELLKTLEIFLKENGNHLKASEKLFIHRRTLRYRLNKIESLLKMNLDNSENRFFLYFLLKMRNIQLA